MFAVFTNMAAIIVGGIIGTLAGTKFPEKIIKAVSQVLGIFTVFIGIKGAIVGEMSLLCLASLIIGTAIGTWFDLDSYITKFGEFLKNRFAKGSKNDKFVEGFVSSSALFGIGAMAILGSINAGLRHDYEILFLKSALDFLSAIMFSTTLGIGVCFSSITILVFEGTMTLLAVLLRPIAENVQMMNEITCCGNILILIIGLNMLNLTKMKVANMLPAIFMVPLFFIIFIR